LAKSELFLFLNGIVQQFSLLPEISGELPTEDSLTEVKESSVKKFLEKKFPVKKTLISHFKKSLEKSPLTGENA